MTINPKPISFIQKLDYIPVISTAKAVVDVITKIALSIFLYVKAFSELDRNAFFQKHDYLNILNKKHISKSPV